MNVGVVKNAAIQIVKTANIDSFAQIGVEVLFTKTVTNTGNVTLHDLVSSLNALGVGPRDLISILQTIKAAGALQADLVVR